MRPCFAQVPAGVTPLATFDGHKATTWDWTVTNDPVMGGVSHSTFTVNASDATLYWNGETKIVPKLKAPGFCNLETTNSVVSHPKTDATGTTHIVLRVRTSTPSYAGYKFSFAANTLVPQFKSFKANFNITVANRWTTVAIPYTEFSNDWSPYTGNCDTKDPTGKQHHCCTPEHPEVCVKPDDLKSIEALGVWTEGVAGTFGLDLQWIGAAKLADHPELLVPSGSSNETCSGPIEPKLRFNISGRLAADYLPFPTSPKETLAQAICCDPQLEAYAEPSMFFARPDVDLFAHLSAVSSTP